MFGDENRSEGMTGGEDGGKDEKSNGAGMGEEDGMRCPVDRGSWIPFLLGVESRAFLGVGEWSWSISSGSSFPNSKKLEKSE